MIGAYVRRLAGQAVACSSEAAAVLTEVQHQIAPSWSKADDMELTSSRVLRSASLA